MDRWPILKKTVQDVLLRRGEGPKHLAQALGKTYLQAYQWIRSGAVVPSLESGLAILAWLDKNATREEKWQLNERLFGETRGSR